MKKNKTFPECNRKKHLEVLHHDDSNQRLDTVRAMNPPGGSAAC